MSRDPLDDLIEQLETSIPSGPESSGKPQLLPPLFELQWAVNQILWGTEEDRAALQSDPRFRLVMDQLAAAVRPTEGR